MAAGDIQDGDHFGTLCKRGHDHDNGRSLRNKHRQCVECASVIAREWGKANRERNNALTRKWREANPEKVKESQRKYYKANADKRKEYSRKWRESNLEKHKERVREWGKANPEKIKELRRKHHKAKACASVPEPLRPIRAEIFEIESALRRLHKQRKDTT